MPQMPKVELYAAIRRDHRGGMKIREIERKYSVSWRTVRKAVDSVSKGSSGRGCTTDGAGSVQSFGG
ncbi:hypothetical protein ACQEV2_01100 [Streptomyces sp. CA-251387]|uniref:hypothetical protein n=1 Tax=Streptomyces sp. CA-251387 TaxID=3240064 RepID=UPI003D9309B5